MPHQVRNVVCTNGTPIGWQLDVFHKSFLRWHVPDYGRVDEKLAFVRPAQASLVDRPGPALDSGLAVVCAIKRLSEISGL
jgi:hypothetical protein